MNRIVAAFAGMVFVAGLAGCDYVKSFLLSPEDKINSAFPVSEGIQTARSALADIKPETLRKDIDSQLDGRLKLRALNCAKGFAPTWHSSVDEVRSKLNATCFIEADAEIAKWLGYRRIALILAKPPLRPVPASAPPFIVADEYIQFARFAANAGIALVQTPQAIEVVDFKSQKPLYRGTRGMGGFFGFPSANGRLFSEGDGGSLKIREAESGSVLVELPSVRPLEFHWLDGKIAIYNKGDTRKAFIIDWGSGREAPVTAVKGWVQRAVPVPGSESQYLLFTPQGVTKIEIVRDKAELELKLVAAQPIADVLWQLGQSDPTTNASYFFSALRNLTIVSTTTLEFETIQMDPLNVLGGMATPDPDKILFTAQVPGISPGEPATFIYSIGNRTVQPVDRAKHYRWHMLYIAPLHKMGAISDSKIEVFQELPLLEELPLSTYLANKRDVANQLKLDAFERQQSAALGVARVDPRVAAVTGPIAQLARDARIDAVGVYQPAKSPDGRKPGMVEVNVRRSARPIVLVLSSYEPVRWAVKLDSGAKLAAVLVSGYSESQVYGAGNAKVVVVGSAYAYKLEGPGYNALNQEVLRYTGKSIGLFQGKYEASSFRVGGG